MLTRSASARARLLGLEGAAALCGALREEYLPLLPEALPFLAEALEGGGGEHAAEARAQELLRELEELSGESLERYLRT